MREEVLGTDLTTWQIGPFHGALPSPMRMTLALDGETIVRADLETGFLHRGLEKAMERQLWQATVAYADHLDPEGAAFGELALCLAVEEIGGFVVSDRAKSIRIILSELNRISAHMGYIVKMARAVGAETMIHYVLRDREKTLDLFELLSGSRFSVNFVRFGGVKEDVTEGFIERVLELCDLMRVRLKEYNDLFTFNRPFLDRTRGVGAISEALARKYGITGPNARASGLATDIRKDQPYSGYDQVEFNVVMNPRTDADSGDVHDRFVERLMEISQSAEILRQEAESVPRGSFLEKRVDKDFLLPAGEAYVRVESFRGLLGCHVISDGGRSPVRIQFRPASRAMLGAIPEVIRGTRLEDLPIFLASLDLGIAEVDR